MKIFGLGLSRTGTTTLAETLKLVGYNVIHYPSHNQLFSENNNGATDIPVIPHYKELDKRFPNSKFVYTIRDKQEWLNRMGPYLERKRSWGQTTQKDLRTQIYGAPFFELEKYTEAWDKHDKDVKDYFANRPNDLLVINILGGDKPKKLYDFLGLDNPPNEFGHWNKLKT